MEKFINELREEAEKPIKRIWSLKKRDDGNIMLKCGLEGREPYNIMTFLEDGSAIKHGCISKTLGL